MSPGKWSYGRRVAARLYPLGDPCEGCGEKPSRVRHHVDHDTMNNARENIELLCHTCHLSRHPEITEAHRQALAGKRLSAQHREALLAANTGRTVSQATRDKISESVKRTYPERKKSS